MKTFICTWICRISVLSFFVGCGFIVYFLAHRKPEFSAYTAFANLVFFSVTQILCWPHSTDNAVREI